MQIENQRSTAEKPVPPPIIGEKLPLGWDRTNPELFPQNRNSWLLKILGWLLTAVAVSLGAPFWFDLLNKFISVRGSTKPKETNPRPNR